MVDGSKKLVELTDPFPSELDSKQARIDLSILVCLGNDGLNVAKQRFRVHGSFRTISNVRSVLENRISRPYHSYNHSSLVDKTSILGLRAE